ncbi:polymeric immunoglobulin receptor-like protein [Labeo rohita]|nr:polymeric immunoglobulin receptor-like protein [Labeo rohita]
MKILLIFFTFYLISGAVKDIDVTGYSGGSVLVDSGKHWFSDSVKNMAKLPEWRTIINDAKHDKWINEGRFALFSNEYGGLMIYIRELAMQDAGTYRIGVEGKSFINMTLNMKEDPRGNEVHFYKEDDNHICQNISSSKVTQMNGSSERNEERVFTVIISNVSVRDAGVYWCGAETRDTYLTFISLNTKIQLNIIMPPVVRHEGESAEIICPYDSIYKSKPKSLCKGKCSTRDRNTLNETVREEKETKTDRLTLNDDVTASVFTGTITGLTAEDAGKYWCAVTLERDLNYLYTHLIVIMNEGFSMIIIISVCVILLLIGGFTLTMWKLRHERRDPGSAQMNNNGDLPTIPSDGLLYAAVSFQKREESVSDATVRFSKDEIYTDYAMISYRMKLN